MHDDIACNYRTLKKGEAMLLIIVILLISFIVIPLLELTLKENALYFGKLLVYVATAIYVLWMLSGVGKVLP